MGAVERYVLIVVSFLSVAWPALRAQAQESELPGVRFEVLGQAMPLPPGVADALAGAPAEQLPQRIVEELGRSGRFRNIEVWKRDGVFVAAADAILRVSEVDIEGLGLLEDGQYRRVLRTQAGRQLIPRDLREDAERVQARLRERGYANAKVVTRTEASDSENARVTFTIARGPTCLVAGVIVEPSQNVLSFITSPVETGSVCDAIAIRETLERESTRLQSEGYLANQLRLKSLSLSNDGLRGVARLEILRGPRTVLEVQNLQSGNVSGDFSQARDGFQVADLTVVTPEDLRSQVQRSYLRRGYARAQVSAPQRVAEENGDLRVRYSVQPGPQILIGEVEFRGALPGSRREALDKLQIAPGFFTGQPPYVESDLEQYRDRLLTLLLDAGYVEAKVEPAAVSFNQAGNRANLVFRFDAGPLHLVRSIAFLGKPRELESLEFELNRTLGTNAPFTQARRRQLEDELRLAMLREGYFYAAVEVKLEFAPGEAGRRFVDVFVEIKSGIQVRIRNIYAEGDLYDKRERIVSESGLEAGMLFTLDALTRARQRVLKHDLFGSVIVEPADPGALERREQQIDVVIRTRRRPGFSLGLGPSFASKSGYKFSVDFSKNNITRNGLRFVSTATISQDRLQRGFGQQKQLLGRKITAGFSEPLANIAGWVSPLDLIFTAGSEVANEPLNSRYYETLDFTEIWRPSFFDVNWEFKARLGHEWSKALGVELVPLQTLDQPTIQVRELGFSLAVDTRNNIAWPTRGGYYEASLALARFGLGSEVQFNRNALDLNFYFPLASRFSSSLSFGGVQLGQVVNSEQVTVTAPSSRRATLSGRALVRGFPESGLALGPLLWVRQEAQNVKCPTSLRRIGASNVLYVKSEARYRFFENWGAVSFIDTGSAYFTGNEAATIQDRLAQYGSSPGTVPTGGTQECQTTEVKLINGGGVDFKQVDFLRDYLQTSYWSAGIGLRYIVENLASLSLDWGYPLRDPADKKASCSKPADAINSLEAPACVNRRANTSLFQGLSFPGAFHVGVGATF